VQQAVHQDTKANFQRVELAKDNLGLFYQSLPNKSEKDGIFCTLCVNLYHQAVVTGVSYQIDNI